jgi:hypothetical protein
MVTAADVGFERRHMMLSIVVFPALFGPRRPRTSPSWILKVIFCGAGKVPNPSAFENLVSLLKA